ncbi:hypothetical protein D3C83_01820 [compost metagenome]
MNFVRSKRVQQIVHPGDGVRRITAPGIAGRQFLERVERLTRRLGIALAEILPGDIARPSQVVVEIREAFQVIDVIHIGMVGMELDEAVRRDHGLHRLAVLVIGIGNLDLGLLRETPVWIA